MLAKQVPWLGMTFTKSEDAYTFYNDYAYIVGFSMVRWHPYKDKKDDKNGNVTRQNKAC